MPELIVYRGEDGKLAGLGEKGGRAWAKFRKIVAGLEVGEMMGFKYRLPRCPHHHKWFFGAVRRLFERQERFEQMEHLLEWLKVGAGHVDFVPGSAGLMAIPRSICWEALDEQEFIEFNRAMSDFLNTPDTLEFLWPHLAPATRHLMLETTK